MKPSPVQFAAIASVLWLSAAPALAQQTHEKIWHGSYSGPMDRCQPALPSHEAAFRKRPLALQNEGAGTAFVTCAFAWDLLVDLGWGSIENSFGGLYVWFVNRGAATATVSCTAVFGRDLEDTVYSTQSVTLGPGTKGILRWNNQLAFELYRTVAVSCAIPPGVGVNESVIETLRADFT